MDTGENVNCAGETMTRGDGVGVQTRIREETHASLWEEIMRRRRQGERGLTVEQVVRELIERAAREWMRG